VERMEKAGPDARAPLMQEAEAEAVASRVRRLLDEEGWEQRDVVVLTPAQTHVDLYQQALLARGVDVYVVGGKGYYARDEVADLTSLLTLLLNTHDDLSLVTVLRSPLVGLSDDGLYLLGREARKARARSLWEVVRGGRIPGLGEVDRRLLLDLVERLAALRRRVGRPGLARLLDDAASECGYDLCVLASPEGKRRFANVRKLMRMADDFEALEGPDLAGFVGAIESMGDLSEKEGSAPTLAEGENVVRVMTVHQAKGLEFPLVVLAGLGSDAPRGARSQFVLGSDGRVGVFLKGSQRSTYESCDLSWGPGAEIATAEDEKEREEDIRLLYVAMTRAKERLLLVGAKPRDDRLKSCRIGRIALGLGLDGLPAGGDTVPLEGLDAIMVGVPAFAAAVEGTGPAGAGVSPVDAGAGPAEAGSSPRAAEGPETPCPRFVERVPIGAGPGHVSFSALAVYQRCPRQFYLERMLGLRLDRKAAPVYDGGPLTSFSEESDDESVSFTPDEAVLDDVESRAGREVGLLVHALLERHALDEKEPGTDLLRGEALEALHVAGASLPPGEVERALSLTQAFWRSPFAGDQDLLGATRETPFVFTQGELIVSGVMDLVWQVDDVWHIADYKTNALHGRTAAEVAAGYELQATVYSLAALRAGAQAVVMDFLFLEHPEAPVTLRFSRDDQTRLDGLLDQALGGLRRGDFSAVPGEECARCSVAEVCAGMVRPSGHGIQ
jgi:ATP-dependent helicase/nuclease subunit A